MVENPKQEKQKHLIVSMCLPPPLVASLDREADRMEVSRSAVVRMACRQFLKRGTGTGRKEAVNANR